MPFRIKIVGGPSKWDLMLALFEQRAVTFKLDGGDEVKVIIRALSSETGEDTVALWDGAIEEFTTHSSGGWLIEGEVTTGVDDMIRMAYLSYCTDMRDGVYSYVDSWLVSDMPYYEPLRFEWGDRLWGDDGWRT